MNIHDVKPHRPLTVPPQTPLWMVDTNYVRAHLFLRVIDRPGITQNHRRSFCGCQLPLTELLSRYRWKKCPFQLSKSIDICSMSGKHKVSPNTASHVLNCILQPRRDSSSINADK